MATSRSDFSAAPWASSATSAKGTAPRESDPPAPWEKTDHAFAWGTSTWTTTSGEKWNIRKSVLSLLGENPNLENYGWRQCGNPTRRSGFCLLGEAKLKFHLLILSIQQRSLEPLEKPPSNENPARFVQVFLTEWSQPKPRALAFTIPCWFCWDLPKLGLKMIISGAKNDEAPFGHVGFQASHASMPAGTESSSSR